jgi:hypothetical protein
MASLGRVIRFAGADTVKKKRVQAPHSKEGEADATLRSVRDRRSRLRFET